MSSRQRARTEYQSAILPFTPATSKIASKNVLHIESRAESILEEGADSYTLKFFDVQKFKRLKALGSVLRV